MYVILFGLRAAGKVLAAAALSYKHTIAVTSEDRVYAWGYNGQVRAHEQ